MHEKTARLEFLANTVRSLLHISTVNEVDLLSLAGSRHVVAPEASSSNRFVFREAPKQILASTV